MNRRIVLSVGLLIAAACSKKSSAPAEAPAAPENAGPATLGAAAFDADYRSLQGLELLNKYRGGVALTGAVQRTLVEMDESFHVMLDAGGGKWISLAFTDKGAAAKAKGIKAGSQVKATCQKVLGAADKYIMVGECSLS
jgi:hypothetical protein